MPSDFTPNNVWGSTSAADEPQEMTLPSGQTCLAQKVSILSLIDAGILNQADSLTAMVDQYTRKVKGGKGPDGMKVDQAILGDTEAIKMMIAMADRAIPAIVVTPPVSLHFSERKVGQTVVTKKYTEDERVKMRAATPGLIFTDQIELDDKMHLFEWGVGGLQAFSSFRGDSPVDVGGVVNVGGSPKPTKRRPRGK